MNNIKVDDKLKKVEIKLNKQFYTIEAVKKAVEEFKEICKISLSDKKDILVSLRLDTKEDVRIIGYEFCNYVLALMKSEALV